MFGKRNFPQELTLRLRKLP